MCSLGDKAHTKPQGMPEEWRNASWVCSFPLSQKGKPIQISF